MYVTHVFYISFLECWDHEPDNRPTMNQVVSKLKSIIVASDQKDNQKLNPKLPKEQTSNLNESSQVVQDLSMIIDEIVDLILRKKIMESVQK